MLALTRKTDLALLILSALVGRAGYVSIRSLAREHRLPYRFAADITRALAAAGLLAAREGLRGGYCLAKRPEAVTVGDVVAATEGERAFTRCLDPHAHASCPQSRWCTAKEGMSFLQQRLQGVLARTTLADYLKEHARARS